MLSCFWTRTGVLSILTTGLESSFGITDTDCIIGEKREVFRKKAIERLVLPARESTSKCGQSRDDMRALLIVYEENILDIFNNVIGMICIYRDVTRQRQVESG